MVYMCGTVSLSVCLSVCLTVCVCVCVCVCVPVNVWALKTRTVAGITHTTSARQSVIHTSVTVHALTALTTQVTHPPLSHYYYYYSTAARACMLNMREIIDQFYVFC